MTFRKWPCRLRPRRGGRCGPRAGSTNTTNHKRQLRNFYVKPASQFLMPAEKLGQNPALATGFLYRCAMSDAM
eukprot:1589953-Prymnesium_polylepis.2